MRTTLFTCDCCFQTTDTHRWDTSVELRIEFAGGIQSKTHKEVCISCAQSMFNIVQDKLSKRQFSTTSEVCITNEEIKDTVLTKVRNVRVGEGF